MWSAVFSPDGRRVVTASGDTTARVWDVDTGETITVLRGHEGDVLSAAFSPDGRRVVTASYDMTARIWDAETGRVITILQGHGKYVKSASFSPDGQRVVTASIDSTARIWGADTGKTITVLRGHEGDVRSAAFSPDGRRVVTASYVPRIWSIFSSTQDLVDVAKRLVPRCLTRDQRARAFLDPEPPAWCIEMEKWPYQTQDWKDWLKFTLANTNPPLPDTPEWQK